MRSLSRQLLWAASMLPTLLCAGCASNPSPRPQPTVFYVPPYGQPGPSQPVPGQQPPAPVANPLPPGVAWDGVYFNPVWGYLHVVTRGATFEARWRRPDSSAWGEMQGSVQGDTARFRWTEHKVGMVGPNATTGGRGHFRFLRAPSSDVDDRIAGEWGIAEAESGGGEWSAIKQRNLRPDLGSVSGH